MISRFLLISIAAAAIDWTSYIVPDMAFDKCGSIWVRSVLSFKLVFQLWINLGDIGFQQTDSFLLEAGVPAVRFPL